MDHVLAYMKKNNVPLTREDYLDFAYLGNPPEELGVEEEAQLPEEFQRKQDQEFQVRPSPPRTPR
jgi:hypothetical protein